VNRFSLSCAQKNKGGFYRFFGDGIRELSVAIRLAACGG
jgi:hypothetical protein